MYITEITETKRQKHGHLLLLVGGGGVLLGFFFKPVDLWFGGFAAVVVWFCPNNHAETSN